MSQSVKDALADAETLRMAWREIENDCAPSALWTGHGEWKRIEHKATAHLWQAGLLGHYIPHECAESAREAARAAFRAVPALRGE